MKWNNRYLPSATTLLLLAALGLSAPSASQAQVPTWIATANGTFSNGANWVGGTAPSASATSLTFNAASNSGNYTATNDLGAITLSSLTFDATALPTSGTATAQSITLANAASSTLSFAAGAVVSTVGVRSNTAGSPGVNNVLPAFTLQGDITFSTAVPTTGNAATGNAITASGLISGSGNITKIGNSNLTISGNSINTFTGNLNIGTSTAAGGTVEVQNNGTNASSALGASTNNVTILNGNLTFRNDNIIGNRTLTLQPTYTSPSTTATAGITLNGNANQNPNFASLVLSTGGNTTNVNYSIAAIRGSGGTAATVTHTIDENLTLGGGTSGVSGNLSLSAAASATLAVTGIITDGSATYGLLRTNGPGTVLISGANSYKGDTLIGAGNALAAANYGITRIGANNAIGITGNTTFNNVPGNATIDLNGFNQQLNNLASTENLTFTIGAAATPVPIIASSKVIDNQASGPATLTLNNTINTTFRGLIQNTGGTLSVEKNGGNQITLTGASTYDGTTTINAGTIQLTFADATSSTAASNPTLGSTVGDTVILGQLSGTTVTGGRLQINNTSSNAITINENFDITGSGLNGGDGAIRITAGTTQGVTLTGTIDTSAAVTGLNNAIRNDAASSAPLNITGNITGSTSNLLFRGTGTTNISGIISGQSAALQFSDGNFSLTGLNTYSGQTQINSGTLTVNTLADTGTSSSIGNGTNSLRIGNTGNNGTLIYTGAATSTNRAIQIGSNSGTPAATDTGSAIITNNGTGTLVFSRAAGFNTANPGTSGASRTVTFQGTSDITVAGPIINNSATNSIGVNKNDANTLTLNGASTYTGPTNVNAGTLQLGNTTGSGTGTGNLTVASGAVLSGNGSAASTGTVLINGTVQVGVQGATAGDNLQIGGSITASTTLGAGSSVLLDLFSTTGTSQVSNQTAADTLVFVGGVTIDPTATLTFGNPNGLTFTIGDVFKVFDWGTVTGGTPTGTFASIDSSALILAPGASLDTSALYTAGTISIIGAIPEPSRMILAGLGVAGMALRRRRKLS